MKEYPAILAARWGVAAIVTATMGVCAGCGGGPGDTAKVYDPYGEGWVMTGTADLPSAPGAGSALASPSVAGGAEQGAITLPQFREPGRVDELEVSEGARLGGTVADGAACFWIRGADGDEYSFRWPPDSSLALSPLAVDMGGQGVVAGDAIVSVRGFVLDGAGCRPGSRDFAVVEINTGN